MFLEQNEEHGEREQSQMHDCFDTANGRPNDLLDSMSNHLEHSLALRLLKRTRTLVRPRPTCSNTPADND
jgi:hypothetical protein